MKSHPITFSLYLSFKIENSKDIGGEDVIQIVLLSFFRETKLAMVANVS